MSVVSFVCVVVSGTSGIRYLVIFQNILTKRSIYWLWPKYCTPTCFIKLWRAALKHVMLSGVCKFVSHGRYWAMIGIEQGIERNSMFYGLETVDIFLRRSQERHRQLRVHKTYCFTEVSVNKIPRVKETILDTKSQRNGK